MIDYFRQSTPRIPLSNPINVYMKRFLNPYPHVQTRNLSRTDIQKRYPKEANQSCQIYALIDYAQTSFHAPLHLNKKLVENMTAIEEILTY